jgi:hypothetical protein
VSGFGKDWAEKTATWNSANSIAAPLSILPEQDTDASGGTISQASLYMPSPKASTANSSAVVSSSGELGYIHTGMQVTSLGSAGVPWRTIRLQPSTEPNTVVPDWAFMDLFTAPITVGTMTKPVFAPHDTATGGRVNVNAWLNRQPTAPRLSAEHERCCWKPLCSASATMPPIPPKWFPAGPQRRSPAIPAR